MAAAAPAAWPRFLSREESARYVGVSAGTFGAEVAAGTWPPGRPRGGKGGKLTWDRVLLDRYADRQSGLDSVQALPASAADDTDAAAVEARLHAQAEKHRSQHGHPPAH